MGTNYAFKSPSHPFGFYENKERERDFTYGQGWTITRFYTGPETLEQQFLDTLTWATRINSKKDSGLCYVTASYESQSGDPNVDPGSDVAQTIFDGWTLTGNTLQMPLTALPKIGLRMLPENIARVYAQVRAWQKKVDDETDPTIIDLATFRNALVLTNPNNGNETFDGRILFEELVLGRNEVEVVQPVLRHVQVVTALSQVKASATNVGRAYTWGALLEAEPSLPTAIIIGVDSLEDMNALIDWKWQKRCPTVDVQTDGKRQITQEYWGWEAFDTWRYGSIIVAS